MKKFAAYALPLLVLLLFVLVTQSDNIMKKPLTTGDNVPNNIAIVEKDLREANWQQAAADRDKLEAAWEKVSPRLQFGADKDEILLLDQNLARLKGYILAKDRAGALVEIFEIKIHWKNIGR